jgi:hypothetical protein
MLELQRNHCSHPSDVPRTDIIVQFVVHGNDPRSSKHRNWWWSESDWVGSERNTDELEEGKFDLFVDIDLHSDVCWRWCFSYCDNIRYRDAIITCSNGINKDEWSTRLENGWDCFVFCGDDWGDDFLLGIMQGQLCVIIVN